MVNCLTYIIFDDLPKEKEQEIKEWANEQPNTEYWYFGASSLAEENGGSFCVVTNYHYSRHKLKLYIYQLWKKYHDVSNMRVELWSDYIAEPDEDYGLVGVIEGEEFNEYFSEKTDEEWQKAWQKDIDEWHDYFDEIKQTKTMKKYLQNLAYKWLKKTGYHFPLPVLQTLIHPENLKKFHAQHIIPYYMWNTVDRWVDPDCFVKQFKYKLVDELLKEIQIKVEETPDGVMYSADLLLRNI